MMKTLTIRFLALACLFCWASAAPAGVDEGVLAYQQGNFKAAYQAFLPAAEMGDPAAQYGLGVLHYGGRGVDQDYVLAWKWFTLAADQGHEQARMRLAATESKLSPVELEQAQALVAEFQAAAMADLVDDIQPDEVAVYDPGTAVDTDAVHPNAPGETVAEPVLPDQPVPHGRTDQTPDADMNEVTAPVAETPMAETPVAETPSIDNPALPLPGLAGTSGPAPEPGPDPEPEPEPAPEPVTAKPPALPLPGLSATPATVAEAEPVAQPVTAPSLGVPLAEVDEVEYLFAYPEGWKAVDMQGEDLAFARDEASLSVAVNGVGGAQGVMEPKLCRQISGMMMADLMQRADAEGALGGDFLGGGGARPEVKAVAPPTLEDVAPGVQRCSFAFAHNIGGDWRVVEQANYYKLKVPKLYSVTMRYLLDSELADEMRPAYEAFQVK